MKIKEIEITGLFGAYNHVISFADTDIKFIYGTNGIGKTTILNLLDWLFHLNLTNLAKIREIPFESFCVSFEDGTDLRIDNPKFSICTYSYESRSFSSKWEYSPHLFRTDKYKIAEYEFANVIKKKTVFRQVSPTTFAINEHSVLSLQEIAEQYTDYFTTEELSTFTTIPSQILELIQKSQKVALMPVNRLQDAPIQKYMDDLGKRIETAQNKFNKKSDELKQSQRERIKNKKIKLDWSEEEIWKYAMSLQIKIDSFFQMFFARGHAPRLYDYTFPKNGTDLEKQLFYIEIQDLAQQFAVYEEDNLDKKLFTFLAILKSALEQLGDKEISLAMDDGIDITNKVNSDLIPLQKLSSGEQQQIILWYKILFEIPDNSLILIDEPETSLHIDWQMDFLPNLQAVQEIKPLSFLIATHSSAIINGHFELAKSLNDAD